MIFFIGFALWIILNGKITLEICLIGLVLSAALYFFCKKFLTPEPRTAKSPLKRFFLLMAYVWILIVEIIKANMQVLGIAVSRKLDFEPCLVYFKTDLHLAMSRVLLANSITLTPGTITVSLDDDLYCVHCLDRSMAEGIEESVFVKMLRKIEEA